MSYNKETDYQAKINEAVEKGDYESAAQYEKSRNEKIDGENLGYKKTNNYSGWLDKTDYSNVIKDQIESGASKSSVSDTLKKRIEKASGTQGLTQYAYDDVYDKAIRYIMGGTSFSYDKKTPEFKSSYDDEIRNLYRELSQIPQFSYDPYSDDLYIYYKEQYSREGKRAMEDLLGKLSMNTGGVASSYAVSAASQAQDYYNSKLTDKIPELYEDAYARYLDSIDNTNNTLKSLINISDREYSRYLDELSQYNKDREFEYKSYLGDLDEEYRKRQMEEEKEENIRDYDYQMQKLYNETEEQNRKWAQQEYENAQEENQEKINNALKKWSQMGYLDSESAEILGLPAGLRTGDYDYKMKNLYK